MRRIATFALLAVLCLVVLPAAQGAVREETFAALKSSQEAQLVLFYHSREPDSKNVLQTFERASSKTRKLRDLKYKRCDCDSATNQADCKEASFTQGSFIFTSTPETGIVKFISPITVDNLVEHANNLFLDYDDKNVVAFTDEESFFERMDSTDPPRPTFVKYYEDWCGHCQRLKPAFARIATQLKDKVDFVEVHCSKNDVTKAFCSRNQVSSFPVVMLFTGEKKIKFEKEERSVLTMTRFLQEHVPSLRSSQGASDDEDGESAPEPVKEKPKEQPKKRASNDDDDDDELNEEEERRAREQAKEEKKKRKAREKEERQKREEREAEEQAKRDKAKEEKDKSEKAKEEKEKKSVKPPYGGSQSGAPTGERDDSNKASSSSASASGSGAASDQRVDAIENRVKFLVQRVTQLEEFREAQDEQIRRLKKRVKALKLTVRGLSSAPSGSAAAAKDEDDDDKDEL